MYPLKCEQARHEWESGLRIVNSLETIVEIEKVGHELKSSFQRIPG